MNARRFRLLTAIAVGTLAIVACSPTPPASAPTAVATAAPVKAAAPAATFVVPANTEAFPTKGKSITLIVPNAAGGSADILARILAEGLERELGTPIVIVNKAGAGGQIGYTELAKAKPDGYTIGLVRGPAIISQYLDPQRKAVFARKDFQPIALHNVEPMVVVVPPGSPFRTAKDWVEAAKAKPQTIRVSDVGVGSTGHLGTLLTQQAANVQFATVHFADGTASAYAALLGGHTDVDIAGVGFHGPHIRDGAVRALGVMAKEEFPSIPGVKTLEAQGYPVYTSAFFGYAAPAGVPLGTVDVLTSAMKRVMQDPEHEKKLNEAFGLPANYLGPEGFDEVWSRMEADVRPMMKYLQEAQ